MRQPHGPGAAGLREAATDRHGEALPDALELAREAFRRAPYALETHIALISALLAAGEAQAAADLSGDMRRKWSTSQLAIALQATAWRALGDRRYSQLCDYPALVQQRVLDAGALHEMTTALQTGKRSRPSLPAVVNEAIATMLSGLGQGDDPVRSRNRGAYSVQNVSLQTSNADQVREGGWLSGVFCVGGEGRIRFGRPGIATRPVLDADHFVAPQPGLLVLFPSFTWFGVEPSSSPMIVFDLAPRPIDLPDID